MSAGPELSILPKTLLTEPSNTGNCRAGALLSGVCLAKGDVDDLNVLRIVAAGRMTLLSGECLYVLRRRCG